LGDVVISVRFAGDTDIEGLCGLLDDTVIRRRLGNAAAFASTGSYPTVAIPAAAAGYVEKGHNLKFASIQLGANFGI
jgi:hypothetical protein